MTVTNRERIIEFLLGIFPKAICDDCLADRMGMSQRQTANIITRPLSDTSGFEKHKVACDYCGGFKLSTNATQSNIGDRVSLSTKNRKRKPQPKTQNEIVELLGFQSLKTIGFSKVGLWALNREQLQLHLIAGQKLKPALYAFIADEKILYVGKTSRYLPKRLYHYQKPGPTQSTNIRMNNNLREYLKQFKVVEIYAFGDQDKQKIGDFELDIPAGLEDDIIRKTRPIWNSRKR